ncbi:MAG TPA: hypothetical protein VLK23_16725 [Thermodesulfobacteriota bacterium]|nr:hypothetical protein [Thermodesulfobacteriota bacterium]
MVDPASQRCPLCGKQFTESEMNCTSGCLLSRHCHLICCPHCGYSYKEQSAIVDFFKKLLKKKG